MPFQRVKQTLVLSIPQREELERLLHSRTEPIQRVERAKMLLEYAAGVSVSAIARKLGTNRPKVYRCMRFPGHVVQSFQSKLSTDSGGSCPVIPG